MLSDWRRPVFIYIYISKNIKIYVFAGVAKMGKKATHFELPDTILLLWKDNQTFCNRMTANSTWLICHTSCPHSILYLTPKTMWKLDLKNVCNDCIYQRHTVRGKSVAKMAKKKQKGKREKKKVERFESKKSQTWA